MSIEHSSKYCPHCKQRVLVVRPGANHIVHLLLTFLTCGLWLIVWILVAIRIGNWSCEQCGKKI